MDSQKVLDREQSPVLTADARLARLPEPAQRYLRYARVPGQEPIRTIRLKQQGFMRQGADQQKWLPLVAEQKFTTSPPSLLWRGAIRPLPLVSISATDQFSHGHGVMRVKLWPFIPMGHAQGPEIDQGELQRYMGEMVWFPTAWLSDAIEWQGIDDHSVRAILREAGIEAAVVLHINEQGQLTQLTAERYREVHGTYKLEKWSVEVQDYHEVSGMRIPTVVEVTWHLAEGEFTWFRCKIIEIEYNQSGVVTMF